MKSTLHKFFLTLASVLLFGVNASAQSNPDLTQFPDPSGIKFFLSVTGYSRPNTSGEVTPSTVSATVYDGYGFKVVLPTDDCEVGADKATVRAMMHNVASLGLSSSETRRHEVTVNTGVTGIYQKLGSGTGCWLKNCYSFPSATVPVTVVDYNHPETHTFTYAISKSGNTIIGTPSNFQDAHDAWYLITSKNGHVTSESNKSNDSYIGVKKNSYITLGNETFTFTDDVKLSEGGFSMTSMKNAITGGSLVRLAETDPAVKKEAVFFLPAGTCMAIGSSIATLNEDAKITIDFSSSGNAYNVNNILSKVKTAANTSSKDLIQEVLNLFDNLVGMVAYTRNVPITVQFGEPSEPFIQVYKGQETPYENLVTPFDFAEILKTVPNAVGYVWTDLNGTNYATAANIAKVDDSNVNNIVIDYKVGKNGHYYECNNLVLTDKKDFYSPEDFTALSLSYGRTNTQGYNSVCLPFAITGSDVNGTIQTFSNYFADDQQVYFTTQTSIDAGIPCIVYCGSDADWAISKTDVEVKALPISSTNMKGSYIKNTIGVGHYKLNPDGSKYTNTTASSTCTPFRSYLDIDDDLKADIAGSSSAKSLSVVWGAEESTSISNSASVSSEIKDIYSISGTKLNNVQKGMNILKLSNGTVQKVIIK